ncbi:MAG TPA: hypothetical protein ENJ86_06940 [Methylothermaceae bacterium]|nr:hypothetical protein [Methylothermaceae bacterium]
MIGLQTYNLTTHWRLHGELMAVWEILSNPHQWPEWWHYVEQVSMECPGDDIGLGAIHVHRWKTCLPYRLQFTLETTRTKIPSFVETKVTGDLQGIGRCRLRAAGQVTLVRFDWHVHTTKYWMNLLAPIARPVFIWNHARVMSAGEKALQALLFCQPSVCASAEITSSYSKSDFGGGAWRHSK